jgi:hypothetical protein
MTGPPRREQRRSQRHPCRLSVAVTRGKEVTHARTADVSRHGMFLQTEEPPPERLLLKFVMQMPDGPLEATGFVTRRVTDGARVGAGVQFFALASQAKARWDTFVSQLSGSAPPPWAENTLPPPDPVDDSASFLIKLKSAQRLTEFFDRKIRSGQIAMNTPLLREVGSKVALIIIHPESEREFLIRGVVASIDSGDAKSMTIDLEPITDKTVRRFKEFVSTGKPTDTMDLEMRGEQPEQPASAPEPPPPGPPPDVAETLDDTPDLSVEEDVTATFDVDVLTGDLSVDIDVEEGSLPELQVFRSPPTSSTSRPKDPNTLVVRCTACGAFLGPADVTPIPAPMDRVLVRKTCFDRFAGSFGSKVVPRPKRELNRLRADLDQEQISASMLIELALYWRAEEDADLRGPDLAPSLGDAHAKLLKDGTRAKVEARCPMCSDPQLFATWD